MMRMVMEVVMVLAVVGMMLFIMRVSKKESASEPTQEDQDNHSH